MPLEKPMMTFEQLKAENEEAYNDVMEMIVVFAQHLYDKDAKFQTQGLDAVVEHVVSLCDQGFLKITVTPDGSQWQMGVYKPELDGYVAYQG